MTDRAWDEVRDVVRDLERTVRAEAGSGVGGSISRLDLVPLLMAVALPVDDTPRRGDTWVTVKDRWAWWITPAGETDPDKAELWIAPLKRDGQPDYTNVISFDAVTQWQGFPWEGREPTAYERRELGENVIAALGFLSGGPANVDPLTEAANELRAHIVAAAANIEAVDHDHLKVEFENMVRGGLGGLVGDFCARFNIDVAGYLSDLLIAVATEAPADIIRTVVRQIADAYNDAATRDDYEVNAGHLPGSSTTRC